MPVMITELVPVTATPKTGDEPFHSNGEALECRLLEFWRWSVSDLVSNATRGRLAEFVVAKALGIPTQGVRDEWAAYDLTSPEGVKVEVKSAAYLQSWKMKRYSSIRFLTRKARAWDALTGLMAAEAKRQADVYVFALLANKDRATLDPLNVGQWIFYVLPASTLDDFRHRKSISLRCLEQLCNATGYSHLREAVSKAGAQLCPAISSEATSVTATDEEFNHPPDCPFCGPSSDACPHLIAVIDRTFETVSGPAESIWNECSKSLQEFERDAVGEKHFEEFREACDKFCDHWEPYDIEGGPGMSSTEDHYWSRNVQHATAKIREWLLRNRKS